MFFVLVIIMNMINNYFALKKCCGQDRSDRSGSYGPAFQSNCARVCTLVLSLYMYLLHYVIYVIIIIYIIFAKKQTIIQPFPITVSSLPTIGLINNKYILQYRQCNPLKLIYKSYNYNYVLTHTFIHTPPHIH